MKIEIRNRSVTVAFQFVLKDAEVIEFPDGRRFVPRAIRIAYSSAVEEPMWCITVDQLKKNGAFWVRDRDFYWLPVKPEWIETLIEEHRPPTLDI